MSRETALLDWLEDKSDWLSPIVVKEVRQGMRGREFYSSFGASLVIAVAIAFVAATSALRGDGTAGATAFTALMVCLTLLGMLVVPISAFSAMRVERMEQTFDLVTITALSPRRVVIGKLMAQAVKLVTFFAALAPFMTMSFLLGGIDFFTIVISLAVLFLWSLWAASAFLFFSTLFKSRAMSGVVFAAAGLIGFVLLSFSRAVFFGFRFGFGGGSRAGAWWTLVMLTTGCVATTVNFVLLAESRLTVPTENRVTPLRIGFLAQFLLIVAWSLSYIVDTPAARSNAAEVLGVVGGLHLALVAMFTVTEDLAVPRRVLLELQRGSRWDWLLALVRPGGGRGAAYVLAQMALFVLAGWTLDPLWSELVWRIAICAYICFFSGVPAYIARRVWPGRATAFRLRVAILMMLALVVVLPDLVYYVVGQTTVFNVDFAKRHLLNPFRVLANWSVVEGFGWQVFPMILGLAGLVSYYGLIRMGAYSRSPEKAPDGVVAVD